MLKILAKSELLEVNRQSMWVEIKNLIKVDTDTEKQKPNAITKLLHPQLAICSAALVPMAERQTVPA